MTGEDERVDARRRRVFVAAVIAGGLAVVVIAVLAVVVLIHELERRTADPLSDTHVKYHKMYEACVERGVARSACADRASAACVTDPIFTNDKNAISDISDVCLDFRH